MGWFSKWFNWGKTSSAETPKSQPISDVHIPSGSPDPYPDHYSESIETSEPRTSILRDTGLQSRTFREALEVLVEAAPTLPGLNLFLDNHGFRSLTQSIRDMNEQVRLNLLQRAEWLSVTNALASRAMQIRTDLIVSEGFKVESSSEDEAIKAAVQEVIDDHWRRNQWEERMFERVHDLGVTGEMIRRIPPLESKIGGVTPDDIVIPSRFTCGMILPQLVRGISLDPWNYEQLDQLKLQDWAFPGAKNEDLSLKIIREHRPGLEEFGTIRGDVFFLGVNRRPGCSRGITDLCPAIEWLDLHDQIVFSDAERSQLMMRFIWDVSLEGASPERIKEYAKELKINPPKPGTIRVHNQRETWDAVSPDLKLQDTAELREAIFLLAWGAMGLPRHWFVEAENVNKSSAIEMADPCFAWARTRRRQVAQYLELEFKFAIQVAKQSGKLAHIPDEELKIRVTTRDPDRSSYETVGATLNDIGNAMLVAINGGFLDTKSAAHIFRTVVGSYGFEIEKEAIDEQEKKIDQQDAMQDQMTIAQNKQQMQQLKMTPEQKMQQDIKLQKMQSAAFPQPQPGQPVQEAKRSMDSYMQEAQEALDRARRKGIKLPKIF